MAFELMVKQQIRLVAARFALTAMNTWTASAAAEQRSREQAS